MPVPEFGPYISLEHLIARDGSRHVYCDVNDKYTCLSCGASYTFSQTLF